MTKSSWRSAAWGPALVFVWMVLFNIRPIQDPDIWWHLASGRFMVGHMTIPHLDVFSLTAKGSPWVNTYWLQEIVIYLLFKTSGLTGLILLKSLLVAALVFFSVRSRSGDRLSPGAQLWGMVWLFLSGQPRGYGWEEKASYVSLACMALLFSTLYPMERRSPFRLYQYGPILFLLWANMHRGFILGLAVLGIYLAEERFHHPGNRSKLAAIAGLCMAATLANPYGWHVYGMGWQDFALSPIHVTGWAQTPFFHLELFWITLAVFWLVVAGKLWKRQSPGWAFLATSLLLSALSMRYASLYPYWVLWAIPWLMPLFTGETRIFSNHWIKAAAWAVILFASLDLRPAFGINPRIFPVETVQFLKKTNLRTPFFHDYELGGFYLWMLEGNPPVLIDGRYPAVEGYQHLFPEMQNAMAGTPQDFQRFLNVHNLHSAIIKYPSTQFDPSPFAEYFPRKDWGLIYWDDLVLVFIQRTRASGPLLRQLEFQHIQPDADPAYWLENVWKKSSPDQKSQLRGEFLRNARLHPGSRRVRRWLDLIDGLV